MAQRGGADRRCRREIELAGIAGGAKSVPVGGGGGCGVGEADVRWTAATRFFGTTNSAADLIDGVIARVAATSDGTALTASAVDARPSQPGFVFLRHGRPLRVARRDEHRRSACRGGHAVFYPPEPRGALVGAYVDVEGRMENGVRVATRVGDP